MQSLSIQRNAPLSLLLYMQNLVTNRLLCIIDYFSIVTTMDSVYSQIVRVCLDEKTAQLDGPLEVFALGIDLPLTCDVFIPLATSMSAADGAEERVQDALRCFYRGQRERSKRGGRN